MAITLSGLASGFDWKSVVEQLVEVERAPQQRLRTEQSTIELRNNAFTSIKTQLGVLQNKVKTLKESSLFDSRLATASDTTAATVEAGAGTALGSFSFDVTQLASAAKLNGTANIGSKLNATNDVSTLTLANAAFRTPVSAGIFSVNGKQVTVATTDTLQSVFDQISTATGGAVTAAYNSTTDRIQLSGTGTIVLGSATDTSNFLQAASLANNGTNSVSSSVDLGAVKTTAALSSSNLATAVTGTGELKINGVSITYDAATDSLSNVISRINNSNAGVVASYDSVNDRVSLTNRTTGDVGVAVEDVTGNFAAATGLSTGTLSRGNNLLYTVNGGGQLSSQSNTITEQSSGIAGLRVTAKSETTFSVDVAIDTAKIKTAVGDLITEYNKAQSMINSNTASTTDAKGKVTAGTLTGDSEATSLNSDLRRLMTGTLSGLTGNIVRLENLGYASNGNDDGMSASDATKLENAITSNLTALKDFFTNSTSGLAVSLDAFINKKIGEGGTLITHQTTLSTQSKNIDTQIGEMEKLVLANQDRLNASFIAMETAQAKINQQLSFLSKIST